MSSGAPKEPHPNHIAIGGVPAAALRDLAWHASCESHLRGIGRDTAAAQARAWLLGFATSEGNDVVLPGDDRIERNLRTVDGLTLVAASCPDEALVQAARLLVERALRPGRPGGACAPRLAYRAIDILARAGDIDTLRSLAQRASFSRVRSYSAQRASTVRSGAALGGTRG